jgi:hypothetical protein
MIIATFDASEMMLTLPDERALSERSCWMVLFALSFLVTFLCTQCQLCISTLLLAVLCMYPESERFYVGIVKQHIPLEKTTWFPCYPYLL